MSSPLFSNLDTNLLNSPIGKTYGGVLHTSNQAVSGSDFKQIYDGFGNPTPLSVSKNAVKIGGVTYDTKAPENETGTSLVYNNGSVTFKNILDTIYPIGSIYLSINPSNPTSLFGGVWKEFAWGNFLVGAGDSNQRSGPYGNSISFSVGSDSSLGGVGGGDHRHIFRKKEVLRHAYDYYDKSYRGFESEEFRNSISYYDTRGRNGAEAIQAAKEKGDVFAEYVTEIPTPNHPPAFGIYIWTRIS